MPWGKSPALCSCHPVRRGSSERAVFSHAGCRPLARVHCVWPVEGCGGAFRGEAVLQLMLSSSCSGCLEPFF